MATSRSMLFPIWLKLGIALGTLIGLVIGGFGWLAFRVELAHEDADRQARLRGLAETLAAGIDGDAFAILQTPEQMDSPTFVELERWLRRAKEANQLAWVGALNQPVPDRFAYVIDVAAAPLPVGYPTFDGLRANRAGMAGQTVYEPLREDEWGRWEIALAPIRDSGDVVVGLLEVDLDANARAVVASRRRTAIGVQLGLGIGLSMLLSVVFARLISRPLRTLTTSALAVADGDLEQSVDVQGRDELGVLADAFNSMTSGLRDRERIREVFGRFVDPRVVAQVLADPGRLERRGDQREVTVLMSDLRGFVATSEEFGPEATVDLLNAYISAMAEVIALHDGNLSELLGDGIVVLFGAPTLAEDDAVRACRCAIAMQRALATFNEERGLELEMGIGVCTGQVIAGHIGGKNHVKYGVVGPPINLAARLEGFTVGNQVLVSETTRARIGTLGRFGRQEEVVVKGRTEPLRCHELLAIEDDPPLELPVTDDGDWAAVDWAVAIQRVTGKRVSDHVIETRVVEATEHRLRIAGVDLPARTVVRLVLTREPGAVGAQVYGTVTDRRDDGVEIRLTTVPRSSRETLDRALAEARVARGG